MTNDATLRGFFETACHVAQCPHRDTCRNECKTLDNSDNSTPQPGFIGRRYAGIVIIGANPGIPNVSPFIEHEPVYLQHVRDFAKTRDYGSFMKYLEFAADYMGTWRNHLTNQFFRQKLGYDIETIAYLNIVKCRSTNTGSDVFATVGETISHRCYQEHLARQLRLLDPTWIIGHWKTIPNTLSTLGYRFHGHIPCYSGKRDLTFDERLKDLVPVFAQLKEVKKQA